MKFSCDQSILSKALNIVSKAVTSRTTIPILKGILLKVDEDGFLTMSASDLDLSIEDKFEIENYEPGEIVVQAKLFGDIIRKLPNDKVNITVNNENVIISCLNSEFNIIGSKSDEFPKIIINEEVTDKILINKDLLKDMIRKTSFAASIDESRGVITGVLFEIKEDKFNMVALDGFRMAISREDMINKKEENIIVPAKILNEIVKIISEADIEKENVEFYLADKRLIFIIDNIKVVLRLLNGDFVEYENILPKENEIRIIVSKEDLLESIERASLLAKIGKNNLVRLEIKDNIMEITSKSEEGNVKEEVIISKEGKDLTIGFNSKYLIDSIKVIEDDEFTMLFNTPISPCLIKPITGEKYEHLILPVRITN